MKLQEILDKYHFSVSYYKDSPYQIIAYSDPMRQKHDIVFNAVMPYFVETINDAFEYFAVKFNEYLNLSETDKKKL